MLNTLIPDLSLAEAGGETPIPPPPNAPVPLGLFASMLAQQMPAAPDSTASGRTKRVQTQPKQEETFEFNDSAKIKTGKYPVRHLKGVVAAAKAIGIDPYWTAALSMQEDSMGKNAGRKFGSAFDIDEKQFKELADLQGKTGIDSRYLKMAMLLRDKIKYGQSLGYNDPASLLQAYNGYGVLTKDNMSSSTAYGVPIGSGIDMRKNPVYGKRLLSLANDLKGNKAIQQLLAAN